MQGWETCIAAIMDLRGSLEIMAESVVVPVVMADLERGREVMYAIVRRDGAIPQGGEVEHGRSKVDGRRRKRKSGVDTARGMAVGGAWGVLTALARKNTRPWRRHGLPRLADLVGKKERIHRRRWRGLGCAVKVGVSA